MKDTKIYSKCKKEYPNTSQYFSKQGNKFRNVCKKCNNKNTGKEFEKIRQWQNELEHKFSMIDTSINYIKKSITFDDL